jgi:hypothetical protein
MDNLPDDFHQHIDGDAARLLRGAVAEIAVDVRRVLADERGQVIVGEAAVAHIDAGRKAPALLILLNGPVFRVTHSLPSFLYHESCRGFALQLSAWQRGRCGIYPAERH